MNRLSSLPILALIVFSHLAFAQMFYPVDRKEPITIRIVDGQDGHTIAHLHVALLAGYDRADIEKHLWREDTLTDERGEIRLPKTLMNLPWLQVLMPKSSPCRANPHGQIFSVERIRNDGLSAPNRCGTVTAGELPGVFTVFAQDRQPAPMKPATTPVVSAGVAAAATIAKDSNNKAQ